METQNNNEPTGTPTNESTPSPEPSMEQIKKYHRAKRNVHIGDIVLSIGYWTVWLGLASVFVTWLDPLLPCRWLGLIITAGAMFGGHLLVALPSTYYSSFILEHRFGLSNQTFGDWVKFELKSWLIGGILGGILLGGLYAALWYGGPLWSVWVWIGVMVLNVVLAKVFPLVILPLFYPAEPLERPSLIDRLTQMASGSGMKITGVFDIKLSKDTKKANAMLTGLGSSRRVYLADTLLEAFDDDQIAVVFAHELGHHIRGHIFKMIGLAAVVSSLLVSVIWWNLKPFEGGAVADWAPAVAALAPVMLILTIFPLFISPITNAISRHFERQCDSDALRLTDDPDAYRSAFEKLAQMNLADPNPPRWEEIMFDDHPAMSKRIAMADDYARSRT